MVILEKKITDLPFILMMLNGEVKTPSFVIFHKSKRDDINSKKVKLVTKLDLFFQVILGLGNYVKSIKKLVISIF